MTNVLSLLQLKLLKMLYDACDTKATEYIKLGRSIFIETFVKRLGLDLYCVRS